MQACVGLAHNLLEFLQIHKMDTDSALIGLSPSNLAMDASTEQERYLMHQVAGWKTLESSSLKADVRKTADKVLEWTTINKGIFVTLYHLFVYYWKISPLRCRFIHLFTFFFSFFLYR